MKYVYLRAVYRFAALSVRVVASSFFHMIVFFIFFFFHSLNEVKELCFCFLLFFLWLQVVEAATTTAKSASAADVPVMPDPPLVEGLKELGSARTDACVPRACCMEP